MGFFPGSTSLFFSGITILQGAARPPTSVWSFSRTPTGAHPAREGWCSTQSAHVESSPVFPAAYSRGIAGESARSLLQAPLHFIG